MLYIGIQYIDICPIYLIGNIVLIVSDPSFSAVTSCVSINCIGTIVFCIVSYNYFWPNLLILIWLYCLQEIIFNKFSKIFLSLTETYYFSSIK